MSAEQEAPGQHANIGGEVSMKLLAVPKLGF